MVHALHGISTISFFAADHEAAASWYADFLGVQPYFRRPGYVEFRLGEMQTELGIIDAKYVPGADSSSGRAGAVVYWHVDDVDAVTAKAVAMGATVLEPKKDRGHGFVTASVVDPFGNILGIMFNPHFLEMMERAHNGEGGGDGRS